MISAKDFLGIALSLSIVVALGCSDNEANSVNANDVRIGWTDLTKQRVLFAHQSVGDNILEGARQLAERDGVELPVENWAGGALGAGINHFRVGSNGDPQSKLEAFRVALGSVEGAPADIALLKLCYVDFGAATDAKQLADMYISAYRELAMAYPETKFVAVTAPLTVIQTGPKAWIKRAIGVPVGQSVENAKRAEFNKLLRETFGPTRRVFDLAAIESSASGSSGTTDGTAGRPEGLAPALTDDGGHLNRNGQRLVASEMLAFLADVSSER